MVQRLGIRVLAQLTALENNQCRRRYYSFHLSIHPSSSISHLDWSIGGLSRNWEVKRGKEDGEDERMARTSGRRGREGAGRRGRGRGQQERGDMKLSNKRKLSHGDLYSPVNKLILLKWNEHAATRRDITCWSSTSRERCWSAGSSRNVVPIIARYQLLHHSSLIAARQLHR